MPCTAYGWEAPMCCPIAGWARRFARRLAPECCYVPGRACRRDPDSGIEMENAGSVVCARGAI
jgi:hypothetical protein